MLVTDFIDIKGELLSLASDVTINISQIEALIKKAYSRLPIPAVVMKNTFVVRCSMNNVGEAFKHMDRCSYPPDLVKAKVKMQRANYPQQQVFYCSIPTETEYASASSTCVVETAWEYIEQLTEPKQYVTLSKWICNRQLILRILPFSEKSCQKNLMMAQIRAEAYHELCRLYSNPRAATQALEFISEAFSATQDKALYYKITAAFFNAFLINNKSYDGLAYASANTDGAGVNIALKKELINDGTLQFNGAIMYCLNRNPNDPKHLSVLPSSDYALPDGTGCLTFKSIPEINIF